MWTAMYSAFVGFNVLAFVAVVALLVLAVRYRDRRSS